MQKINGYIVAPFKPMHSDGSLNLDIIPEYASFLKKKYAVEAGQNQFHYFRFLIIT